MTALASGTFAAYGLALALLIVEAVIDLRTRRIPNWIVLAMACLWVLWRLYLGLVGGAAGIDFAYTAFTLAPDLLLPGGTVVSGLSGADGIMGALLLGGGLLVITAVYEMIAGIDAFGGGDIKLLAVLGLFLGWYQGTICVLLACVFSLIYAGVAAIMGKRSPDPLADPATLQALAQGEGEPMDTPVAMSADNQVNLFKEPEKPSRRPAFFLMKMPFGPFIALGAICSFLVL